MPGTTPVRSSANILISVRRWTDRSERDSPEHPYDPQVCEKSGPNLGSNGASTPHNEGFRHASSSPGREGIAPAGGNHHQEGASPTSLVEEHTQHGRPSFRCTVCSISFTQKQVRTRHHREKHLPSFECWYPKCKRKWSQGRKSEYKKHLRKKHGLEDDKINEILGRPPSPSLSRLRGRVIESDPPPFSLPPPPMERDRQTLTEGQQLPHMLPPLTEGNNTNHASPPVTPSMAYDPYVHAEPDVTTTKHVDSSGLEQFSDFSPFSKEDIDLLGEYYRTNGHFRFPSVREHHIPALPSPVSGDPIFELSGPMTLNYTPVVENREIETNIFAALSGLPHRR